MSKIFWKNISLCLVAILFCYLVLLNPVSAFDSLVSLNRSNRVAQVTSISQISDISPTQWYFQDLQSLLERYGCVAGYPDGTYRPGRRAIVQSEVASMVVSCMQNIDDATNVSELSDDVHALNILVKDIQKRYESKNGIPALW